MGVVCVGGVIAILLINRPELSGWGNLTLEAGRVTTVKYLLMIRRYGVLHIMTGNFRGGFLSLSRSLWMLKASN